MNSLSWFLYLADVIGNFRGIAHPFAFFGGVAFFIAVGVRVVVGGLAAAGEDEAKAFVPLAQTALKYVTIVFTSACLVLVVAPSTNTLYAIAASEMGEKIVKSESVQGITDDATKALQQWIKRQIEPETKK